MNWIYLFIAGALEVGWPLGLKIAQTQHYRAGGIAMAVICMALSGVFLFLAQRAIPIGTAYVIWTSIGAIGTFAIGVIFFGDPSNFLRYFAVLLILTGVIILKAAH